ncbi:hypothetical protein B0H14DRAFT_3455970 [Mycena olivaceomarginata]|nr:hypothetical protein B0H14DRAFT_3455970 [Mycena olivaceomarginata]
MAPLPARLLLSQGAQVNALVRDLCSPAALELQSIGATLFKGGFEDVPAITAAIKGVTGVFLNTFPNPADPTAETRAAETPAYNYPEYIPSRVLTVSYTPGFKLAQLDAADVSQFAAAALLDPARFAGVEVDLVYEALTFEEIAAELSGVLGAEVKVKYRTEEETVEARKKLPTVEMQLGRQDASETIETDRAKLAEYGFRLTSFREFLEREQGAIRSTMGLNG